MITININKAKEIKKDSLREERKPLLEALDIEYMKALEQNDTQKMQEVVAQKQALRDVTQHPDLLEVESVEELKNLSINDLI
jgi:hypothetical protein